MTTVTNLRTGEKREYSCGPSEAVISAYAQERNDNNTWDYVGKYGDMVQFGAFHVFCGNWGARMSHVTDSTIRNHFQSLPVIEAMEKQ